MEKVKEVNEIQLISESLIERSRSIEIKNTDTLKVAVELSGNAKKLIKKYDNVFDPLIAQAKKTVKDIQEEKNKLVDPLEKIIDFLKGKMQIYNNEQERKRAEEAARLYIEAYKRQDEERLREAVRLEREGKKEEAEEVLNEKPQPVNIIIQSEEKIDGLYFVEEWKFKIIDETKIPREYLIPDVVKIGKMVRAMRRLTSIEGIEIYSEKKPRQREV